MKKLKRGEKIFFLSVVVWVVLFYPIGLIHELGHIVICISQDGVFPLDLVFSQLRVNCDPLPSPLQLYWSFGGFFGMIASLIPLIFRKVRTHPILVGGLTGSAISQFLYFLAEGWAHYQYMGNNPYLFLSITLATLLAIFYFSRKVDKSIKNST
ncbi:MAG: hypothetical protein JRZ94_02230 [Nitrososphaerota archaeon]|nr:hypothetical protein [Nitrososphaerota archaeon]